MSAYLWPYLHVNFYLFINYSFYEQNKQEGKREPYEEQVYV